MVILNLQNKKLGFEVFRYFFQLYSKDLVMEIVNLCELPDLGMTEYPSDHILKQKSYVRFLCLYIFQPKYVVDTKIK